MTVFLSLWHWVWYAIFKLCCDYFASSRTVTVIAIDNPNAILKDYHHTTYGVITIAYATGESIPLHFAIVFHAIMHNIDTNPDRPCCDVIYVSPSSMDRKLCSAANAFIPLSGKVSGCYIYLNPNNG
jgi:hypothetical protein